jgi:hypothetical protein
MWWANIENMVKKFRMLSGKSSSSEQNQPCIGNHREHICHLAQNKDLKQIKFAATNPKYVCTNCGRVAESDKNLCNPFAMEKIPLPVQ